MLWISGMCVIMLCHPPIFISDMFAYCSADDEKLAAAVEALDANLNEISTGRQCMLNISAV